MDPPYCRPANCVVPDGQQYPTTKWTARGSGDRHYRLLASAARVRATDGSRNCWPDHGYAAYTPTSLGATYRYCYSTCVDWHSMGWVASTTVGFVEGLRTAGFRAFLIALPVSDTEGP